MKLSEHLRSLHAQLMDLYANNTGGYFMTAADFQAEIDWVQTMLSEAEVLENKVPPEIPDNLDANIIKLDTFRSQRR